jgi:hypothetical protein
MLRYDQQFFNRMYGGERVFSPGDSVAALEYQDALRGWRRLFEEPTELYRRLVMLSGEDRGMVELEVYGDDCVVSARPVIGPEAWGRLPYAGPAPTPALADAIAAAFRPGTALDAAFAAMPAGAVSWWGDEERDGGRVHYYVLTPPALLIVTTKDDHVAATQTMDHVAGARLLSARLEENGLLPIPLSRREDYSGPAPGGGT